MVLQMFLLVQLSNICKIMGSLNLIYNYWVIDSLEQIYDSHRSPSLAHFDVQEVTEGSDSEISHILQAGAGEDLVGAEASEEGRIHLFKADPVDAAEERQGAALKPQTLWTRRQELQPVVRSSLQPVHRCILLSISPGSAFSAGAFLVD